MRRLKEDKRSSVDLFDLYKIEDAIDFFDKATVDLTGAITSVRVSVVGEFIATASHIKVEDSRRSNYILIPIKDISRTAPLDDHEVMFTLKDKSAFIVKYR